MTAVTFAAVAGSVVFLAWGSIPALKKEGLAFFSDANWAYRQEQFGAAAMLYGSAAVAVIALILAVPIAVATAVFTSEIAGPRLRVALKVVVELLAGIPSVVYGLLAVLFLREWIADLFEKLEIDALSGDTVFTAGFLLAVMVLPTIATLADDALQAVKTQTRHAARGLGLTRAETILSAVMPTALPGIIGATLLGFGRAVGETIAVFLVIGRADNRMPESFFSTTAIFDAGQTITSKLGGAETNIAVGDQLHTSAMLALGFCLLIVVLLATFAADFLRNRISGARS